MYIHSWPWHAYEKEIMAPSLKASRDYTFYSCEKYYDHWYCIVKVTYISKVIVLATMFVYRKLKSR